MRLGSSPDSWGVWFGDDPRQPPWEQFLDEVAAAGYEAIELGAAGYLPRDPSVLGAELDRRGLRVSGSHVMFDLESPEALAEHMPDVRATCELLRSLGAQYLVVIDDTYTNLITGEPRLPRELSDAGWRRLIDGVDGFGTVEQDMYPAPFDKPFAIAKRAREYLRSIGLG